MRALGKAVAARWATLLGLAFAVLTLDGLEDGVGLGNALALAAFGYLLVALVDRPGITWPLVVGLVGVIAVLRLADIPTVPVLAVAAFALAVAAVVSGRLRTDLLRRLQAPAAWVFGAAALAATLVSVELGSVIVAVGLIAHAVWDGVLWRAEREVVSRSFVEWCAVFDVVVGVGILVVVTG
jgi:hypothetical protein